MIVTAVEKKHIGGIKKILDDTELFPSEMLEEMIANFISNNDETEVWLACEKDSNIVGFCYAKNEQLTEGTWNMLAIAVSPDNQAKGIGSEITVYLERFLKSKGQRLLIVDTSGLDEFSQTRKFYHKNGYIEEARIKNYWSEGDDKIIFSKAL